MTAPAAGLFNPASPEMDAQARNLYRYGGDPTMAMLSMLKELGYRGSTFMNPFMSSMLGAAPGLQNAFLLQQALNPAASPEGQVDLGNQSTQAFADFLRQTLSGGNIMGALASGRQNLTPALQAAQNQEMLGETSGNPYLNSLSSAFQEGGGAGALDILSSLANPFMPTAMSRAVDSGLKRALAGALYQYSEAPGSYGAQGLSLGNLLFPGLMARPAVAPGAGSSAVGGAQPGGVGNDFLNGIAPPLETGGLPKNEAGAAAKAAKAGGFNPYDPGQNALLPNPPPEPTAAALEQGLGQAAVGPTSAAPARPGFFSITPGGPNQPPMANVSFPELGRQIGEGFSGLGRGIYESTPGLNVEGPGIGFNPTTAVDNLRRLANPSQVQADIMDWMRKQRDKLTTKG